LKQLKIAEQQLKKSSFCSTPTKQYLLSCDWVRNCFE